MRLRTSVATLLVALTTTTLVAATLVAATFVSSANAASMSTWSRLAHCESGGRWSVNTGNGYYGGLQISPSTWRGHGGNKYASLPHRASKGQQVRVAERIKRNQGWGAWPSCSRRIGVR
jgi:hypothetical protein